MAEPEDAARRWRQVLGAHPGSLRLWQEFLAFRRATFPTFGATGIRRDFEDALEVGTLTKRVHDFCRVRHPHLGVVSLL